MTKIAIEQSLAINKWELFGLVFLCFLYFIQSTREILLDRGIVAVLLPLILVLLFGVFFTMIWTKYLRKELLIVFFGILISFANIILRIPDTSEDFIYYNIGMYLIFFSISPILIGIFGIINSNPDIETMINGKNGSAESSFIDTLVKMADAKFLASFGLILAVIYNVFLRQIELMEDMLTNVVMSLISFAICILIISKLQEDFKRKQLKTFKQKFIRLNEEVDNEAEQLRHKEEINAEDSATKQLTKKLYLMKYRNAGRRSIYILCNLCAFYWLMLPFSYPEVYAYLSGIPYDFTVLSISIGLIFGSFMGKIAKISGNKIIFKLTPIIFVISLLFGFAPFFGPNSKILLVIYLIAGYSVGFIIVFIFELFFEEKHYDFEKIFGVFLLFLYILFMGIKIITIERYMPYLEEVIGLGFVIPSFSFYKFKKDERISKGGI